MRSDLRAKLLRDNELDILEMWCPECSGQIVDLPNKYDGRPLLCLDCGRRMTHAEPVAWPGTTIAALDWSRAVWQVEEAKRVNLMADVVDQVLSRLELP